MEEHVQPAVLTSRVGGQQRPGEPGNLQPPTPEPTAQRQVGSVASNLHWQHGRPTNQIFPNATGVDIQDGDFSIGPRATVVVNIIQRGSVEETGGNRVAQRTRSSEITSNSNHHPSRRQTDNLNSESIRPPQRSNVLYEKHLMCEGRGYPLWVPQPCLSLPISYRAKGVCVGDVGIITPTGEFDFLFNICLPANDSDGINPDELPDGFVPISPPLHRTDIRVWREFGVDSYLASPSVSKKWPGQFFESTAPEGAVLTMPKGAYNQELGNIARFKDYVAKHAENWYRFVNGPRGREAQNGDIRVIIGCDKSISWGMATFLNDSQEPNFRVQFHGLQETDRQPSITLEHSGMAAARVGPDPDENQELGATQGVPLRNQCLFMRSLNVTLNDELWTSMNPKVAVDLRDPNNVASESKHGPSRTPSSMRRTVSEGARRWFSRLGSLSRTGGNIADNYIDPTVTIEYSHPMGPPTLHPSKVINEFLLRTQPHVKMAITSDKDWQYVLPRDWASMEPDALMAKICAKSNICVSNGVVYLQRDENTEDAIHKEIFNFLYNFSTFEQYLLGSGNKTEPMIESGTFEELRCMVSEEGSRRFEYPKRLLSIDDIFSLREHNWNIDNVLGDPVHKLRDKICLTSDDTELLHLFQKLGHRLFGLFWRFSRRDDLDEAIWYLDIALSSPLSNVSDYRHLETLLNICSALFQRFRLFSQEDDLRKLLGYTQRLANINVSEICASVERQWKRAAPETRTGSKAPMSPHPLPPFSIRVQAYSLNPIVQDVGTLRGTSTPQVLPNANPVGDRVIDALNLEQSIPLGALDFPGWFYSDPDEASYRHNPSSPAESEHLLRPQAPKGTITDYRSPISQQPKDQNVIKKQLEPKANLLFNPRDLKFWGENISTRHGTESPDVTDLPKYGLEDLFLRATEYYQTVTSNEIGPTLSLPPAYTPSLTSNVDPVDQ